MKEVELPNARMTVRRNDGTIEYDAGTDSYAVHCEEVRARMMSLQKLDKGRLHSRHVAGLFITAPKDSAGEMKVTATVLRSTDPERTGVLLFAGLLSLKNQDPAAYAVLMRRLKESGQL